MGLDNGDREWLRGEFKDIHGRIDKAKDELTESITVVKVDLASHKASPCPDVVNHVKDKHDVTKQVGIIASLTTIAGAIGGGIMWLIKGKGGS